jgi:hypothetical protein
MGKNAIGITIIESPEANRPVIASTGDRLAIVTNGNCIHLCPMAVENAL